MARVTDAPTSRRRRKKVLKTARGGRGGRSRLYRTAKETRRRALAYAYRDRKAKKRTIRQLWNIRINAAARKHGLRYSSFIAGLKKAQIGLNRKVLADLALNDKRTFAEIVKLAKEAGTAKK